jgi:hypothetical protein
LSSKKKDTANIATITQFAVQGSNLCDSVE